MFNTYKFLFAFLSYVALLLLFAFGISWAFRFDFVNTFLGLIITATVILFYGKETDGDYGN
jgi:hypothetical protein